MSVTEDMAAEPRLVEAKREFAADVCDGKGNWDVMVAMRSNNTDILPTDTIGRSRLNKAAHETASSVESPATSVSQAMGWYEGHLARRVDSLRNQSSPAVWRTSLVGDAIEWRRESEQLLPVYVSFLTLQAILKFEAKRNKLSLRRNQI